MKSSGDKTGLGYGSNDSSTTETSRNPKLEKTKLKTMNFVRSSMGQPIEAQSVEDKIAAMLAQWRIRIPFPGAQRKFQNFPRKRSIITNIMQ
ncbi:hypothetical protein F511_37421 [Dorcoceras hygrometricum]|uniref:Uncharacterized protein n=1 Tax=Dorcoceras hygrometricum TaxID=472368 RepID=A0A2Z7CFD2_9LAMI|nr:hypothetical protein F511_37421 [Dorcoceras hygrometricum]